MYKAQSAAVSESSRKEGSLFKKGGSRASLNTAPQEEEL